MSELRRPRLGEGVLQALAQLLGRGPIEREPHAHARVQRQKLIAPEALEEPLIAGEHHGQEQMRVQARRGQQAQLREHRGDDLLRLLSSARFDSQSLLCAVIAGDARLLEKLRREELIPLGSRIRTRLATEVATREELLACLEHLLAAAGNAALMTRELRQTLADHAAGNFRILISMAAELLMSAAQREITTLDEKLYLQVYAKPETQTSRRVAAAR